MSFLPPSSAYALPDIYEMLQPFQVDSVGEIAQTQDPADWAESHLLALILTSPGERVMRPTYGLGVDQWTFRNINPLDVASIQTTLQQQAALYEPILNVISVTANQDPYQANVVQFTVTYSVNNNTNSSSTLSFSVSESGVEI